MTFMEPLPEEVKEPEKKHVLIDRPMTPTESLLLKLDAWLPQQPEWVMLWALPRPVRKEAARLLAKHILTIPVRGR